MTTPARASGDETRRITISFRYLDTTHPSFSIARCGTEYHRLLLSRFRELSSLSVQEFRVMRSGTLRIHRINFADPRVSERSFGVHAKLSADEKGWQFALSANEHGRVHGFLLDETFYVRWLDPEHNLYPGN